MSGKFAFEIVRLTPGGAPGYTRVELEYHLVRITMSLGVRSSCAS